MLFNVKLKTKKIKIKILSRQALYCRHAISDVIMWWPIKTTEDQHSEEASQGDNAGTLLVCWTDEAYLSIRAFSSALTTAKKNLLHC